MVKNTIDDIDHIYIMRHTITKYFSISTFKILTHWYLFAIHTKCINEIGT